MGKTRPHNPATLRSYPYASHHSGWGTPALNKIRYQARGPKEKIQNGLNQKKVCLDRRYKNDHIICIETFVLAVERIIEIQLVQFLGQSISDKRSKRKTHLTESKVFTRSIFNMTRGFLLVAKAFAVPRTYQKLS
jgi:hypothetical protein